jgi:hypothetical protein
MAWISNRPTPGHEKIVSVMMVPVSTAPNCSRDRHDGNQTVRQACARTTLARERPGARGQHVEFPQFIAQARARHPRGHRRERRPR